MRKTYTELIAYANTNINTNGANSILGSQHNTMLNYLIKNASGMIFDSTHPYLQGTTFVYLDATFGHEHWAVTGDMGAGDFPTSKTNASRITKRDQILTGSITPYTGIELGTKTYAHGLGHTNFTVQAFESTGKAIPLNVTVKSNTHITIQSNLAYASAVIFIHEIAIP